MEHQKISNWLNETSDSKFVTRRRNIVKDQLNINYYAGNKIIYNTEVLKSNRCNYNDIYILVRGDITDVAVHATQEALKNWASFPQNVYHVSQMLIEEQ